MFGLIDRWTANIRITRKLLIAPGVAIVLLSLMAPLALKSLDDQARLIERFTTVEMEKSATIAFAGAGGSGSQRRSQPHHRAGRQFRRRAGGQAPRGRDEPAPGRRGGAHRQARRLGAQCSRKCRWWPISARR